MVTTVAEAYLLAADEKPALVKSLYRSCLEPPMFLCHILRSCSACPCVLLYFMLSCSISSSVTSMALARRERFSSMCREQQTMSDSSTGEGGITGFPATARRWRARLHVRQQHKTRMYCNKQKPHTKLITIIMYSTHTYCIAGNFCAFLWSG